jgi:hypothetical protein
MPRRLTSVDIPASSDPASVLASGNFPPRPVLPCGAMPQVLQTTKFIVPDPYRRWEDPYFDGLRVLLAVYPPPIELPADVTVTRRDVHPGGQGAKEKQSGEGKKWELSWTKEVEISYDQKTWLPARCEFKVYHKFDTSINEANWRVLAAIKLIDRVLQPGDRAAFEALSSSGGIFLRLESSHTVSQVKRCALYTVRDSENCLISPTMGKGSLEDAGPPYVVLRAEEFEWCRPTTWGFARNDKKKDADSDLILERGHYRTQPIAYRFSEHASSEWLVGQVSNSALIGVPCLWMEATNFKQGKDFLDTTLSCQLVTQWCQAAEKTDDGYRFRLQLPWWVNRRSELELPSGHGVSTP